MSGRVVGKIEVTVSGGRRLARHERWSDWFEEIEATQAIAAWQVGRAYDPSSGLQYEVFVYQEVMAPVLARYRQEWTYALRVISTDECTSCSRSSTVRMMM
jgi:hypothetical protein